MPAEIYADTELLMSIDASKKFSGGIPADGEDVMVRIGRDVVDGIERYIASRPEQGLERHDVVRLALRAWLADRGLLSTQMETRSVEQKIDALHAQAAALDVSGPPSPRKALNTMKKAVAKNEAAKLKGKLVKPSKPEK